MTRVKTIRLYLCAFIALAGACAAALPSVQSARAASPDPPTSAPDAGLLDGGPPARPAYVPDLSQPPPPDEASEPPTLLDWLKAPAAPEVRVTDPGCDAKRLREWYRVECRGRHGSLVTGERRGVKFGWNENDYRVWVTFPAKRGDVRVILLSRLGKWSVEPNAFVSEQWLEGDPAPLITVIGIPD